jgi:hypothetical protein
MDHRAIKDSLLAASTHFSGDIIEDEWHEIAWLKETHFPERHRFYYTYQHVFIDIDHYELSGDISIQLSTAVYGGRRPKHYQPVPISNQKACQQLCYFYKQIHCFPF